MLLPVSQLPVRDRFVADANRKRQNESWRLHAPPALAIWHLTSLDAPTVAVTWSLGFAWAGGAYLARGVLTVLALTVWCAYVCDRVLDARVLDARGGAASSSRLAQLALRERHFFHWRHRRWMTPLAAAAAIAAATFALALMPSFVRNRGAVLAGATLVYLSGIHALPPRRRGRCLLPSPVRKELLVGVLFTAGCVLPAWAGLDHSRTTEISNQWFWIPAVYFAGLAWLNCWCIARWESPGKTGTVRARHSRRTERFFGRAEQGANADVPLMFAFAGLLLGAAASASQPRAAALILAGAASALLLALLDRARLRLAPLALRAAADFVLLTPLLLIL